MTNPLDPNAVAERSPRWRRRAALAAAAVTVVTTAYSTQATLPAGAAMAKQTTPRSGLLPNKFLIGTWEQPVSSPKATDPHRGFNANGVSNNFLYWKSLGINTLVEIPQNGYTGAEYAAWDAAALKAGLWEMRRPFSDNPSIDSGNSAPNMIAWNLPDEPDKVLAPAHKTPTQVQQDNAADKAVNPTRPTYLSLVGGALAYGWSCTNNKIACNAKAYAQFADWLSVDDYPFDANHQSTKTSTRPKNYISMIGQEMDALWKIGRASQPRMAFIETGHIGNPHGMAVSAPAMKAEIWEAVAHGARGIIYFSDTTPGGQFNAQGEPITPTSTYDNTWPSVANGGNRGIPAMMKQQNSWLASLQSILAGTINPTGMSISVPQPLDAGWRAGSSGKYFIVVNTSASTITQTIKFNGVGGNKSVAVWKEGRSVRINGSGQTRDTFKPYAVHIYQVR